MNKTFVYPKDKNEMYALVISQLEALLEGQRHAIANLSNASALLNGALEDINWVGFYLMCEGNLLLGPFQGNVACTNIAVGKGVCGSAASLNATQLVHDVHKFPGHIACDSASNSEIVVPLRSMGKVVGVLDVDSPSFGRFDSTDAKNLEQIALVIEKSCNWQALAV
jgi:GAF domain-containing protein